MSEDLIVTETEWGIEAEYQQGGVLNDTNIHPAMKDVVNYCKERGRNKLLVNLLAADRHVSVFSLYEGIDLLQQMAIPGLKIAVVEPRFQMKQDARLIEQASLGRGLFIRFFPDRGRALAWLLRKTAALV